MKKFSIGDLMEHDKYEELKRTISTLVNGLNAVSLSLENYYIFEDCIANNDYAFAVELLKKDNATIIENDRKALLFIFENASNTYKTLLK